MNSKLALWLGVLALVSAPAVSVRAEEGPEGLEPPEEMEAQEGGYRQPGMGMERRGPGSMRGERGMPEDRERMMVKVRKMKGGGMGMEGPGLLSEDETIAVIKKNDAAFAQKVADLRSLAPAKYRMIMQMSGKLLAMAKMEGDESVEKDAVRAVALEFESKELSLKYEKASEADRKAIKDVLKGKLAELFDLKSKGQELRVKHMQKEIAKLQKNLEDRRLNKDKIVDQRLQQLTGEGFGW